METSLSPSSCPSIPSSSQHGSNFEFSKHDQRKKESNDDDGLTKGLLVSGLHLLGKTGLLTLESTRVLFHTAMVESFLKEFQSAVNEYVSTVSPQRLSDWGVIFTSSLRLFHEILWEDKVSAETEDDVHLFENGIDLPSEVSRSCEFRNRLKKCTFSLVSKRVV